jgi:TRAP transporter TAXI family solute receptor
MFKKSGYHLFSKKLLVLITVFTLLTIILYGCAPGEQRISVATGGTGGTYYPYGGAMASIINKYISGLEASAEVTGASVENVRLIESNESQLALVMDDVVYHALHAQGAFDHEIELRTLVEMYPHFFHIVVHEESSIQSLNDLAGKKVSVGAPGSGTETMSQQVLEALGLTYDKFNVFRLSFTENTEGLRDRVIDAGIWSVGPPTASIMDLATTHDIRILNFTEEELAAVQSKYPYYLTMTLEGGTYQGVEEDLTAPSVWNSVVVGKNMPEEQAYEIVKALFEHRDELEQVYVGASWTTPENTIDYAIAPLHPGAIRYFKEIGLEVPDRLIPPEIK